MPGPSQRGSPSAEGGARHRRGGAASTSEEGLQAREDQPADDRMFAEPAAERGSNGAADRSGPTKLQSVCLERII